MKNSAMETPIEAARRFVRQGVLAAMSRNSDTKLQGFATA
jgi:hypothetical protein